MSERQQELFNYVSQECGYELLEGQMYDIEVIVNAKLNLDMVNLQVEYDASDNFVDTLTAENTKLKEEVERLELANRTQLIEDGAAQHDLQIRLDKANERIKRKQQKIVRLRDDNIELDAMHDTANKRLEEYGRLVKKYARHTKECVDYEHLVCICGLREALRALQEVKDA